MKICYGRRLKSGNGRLRDFARHLGGFCYFSCANPNAQPSLA